MNKSFTFAFLLWFNSSIVCTSVVHEIEINPRKAKKLSNEKPQPFFLHTLMAIVKEGAHWANIIIMREFTSQYPWMMASDFWESFISVPAACITWTELNADDYLFHESVCIPNFNRRFIYLLRGVANNNSILTSMSQKWLRARSVWLMTLIIEPKTSTYCKIVEKCAYY